MKRHQSRLRSGRFARNTLENTFGLTVQVCPHCRILNPRGVREPELKECHACGNPLVAQPKEANE